MRHASHRSRPADRRQPHDHDDQARDNDAIATGGSTLRYGWDDVTRRPCATAAQVHAALAVRKYTGRLKPCSPSRGTLRQVA
jgi:hypothetical protein